MKTALLLIDLQNDYLRAPELQPAAGQIVHRAAQLLAGCREQGIAVIHIVTAVRRDPDNRMPHWKQAGIWKCEAATQGQAPPESLRPIAGERTFSKQFFSAFGAPDLDPFLRSLSCQVLLLAGVHLHACVRATAIDAYERGYQVRIAEDAVASDDPIHAAITRRYLARRGTCFSRVAQILKSAGDEGDRTFLPMRLQLRSPSSTSTVIAEIPIDGPRQARDAVAMARSASLGWSKREISARASILLRLAGLLVEQAERFANQIASDVGKPIALARAEVRRSIALLHGVANRAADRLIESTGAGAVARQQPLGVVAVVTPWNNPLAIPIGKIAPALLYGNAVVWKPAPPGTLIARRLAECMRMAGWQEDGNDLLTLVSGDATTAATLAEDPGIDGVTLSGSLQASYALQEICNRRHVPFQGEMGGNNAAIVWDDADLRSAARQIAAGAFGFAGQRCTANRRAIVPRRLFAEFAAELRSATRALPWGDPIDETTLIGPLIDVAKRDEIIALLNRARDARFEVVIPHQDEPNCADLMKRGAYHPPAIVYAEDASAEIVQEESFGPVLVVQQAADFDEAIRLTNGVRQGLVAALFCGSAARRERFLGEVRCGVLKLNASTVDADATSPLGGWKASGVGPAEHGASDREFFCRAQTIYNA